MQAYLVAWCVFEVLDTYERGQIAAWGTAFTTYEDFGDEVCAELNQLANRWRAQFL